MRAVLRPRFELAEDSPSAPDAYIEAGPVLVAVDAVRSSGTCS